MVYRIVVWEGRRPADDEEGGRVFDRIVNDYLVDEPVKPTPAIRRFVRALAKVWTDDAWDPDFVLSPWKWNSLIEGASGPALYLGLRNGAGPTASSIIAAMAQERGLVTFDPQVRLLRPVSEEVTAAYFRRRASGLN